MTCTIAGKHMQKFVRKKQYKARRPEKTVSIIKNILAGCRITLSCEERYYDKPDVASCRIWISEGDLEFGDFGTNGKGMTREYSLASAYAEFMERLQNFILFGDYAESAFRKGLTKYMTAPDEVMMSAKDSFKEAGDVLRVLLRLKEDMVIEEDSKERMACVPYMNMITGQMKYLPHKTLRMVTGSNGMCAGNNYREAIVQGLSEIYERAAILEAYRDNPPIKRLHLESFQGNAIYDRLLKMKSYGFNIKILDLSMGKDYPVVAMLLEKDGKKAFRAGADPCPVTALERCLTEIYQGDEDTVRRFFKSECCPPFSDDEWVNREINEEEIAYHVDGSGKAPYCIFNPQDEYSENFAGTDGESEEADFDYMIALTRKLGFDLYIRDWSFLGFPSYHVIIPQLSNYDLIYDEGEEIFKWSFESSRFRNDRFTKGIADILGRMFEIYEKNLPSGDGLKKGNIGKQTSSIH